MQPSAVLTITASGNLAGSHPVQFALLPGAGYDISGPASQTVTLQGTSGPASIDISALSATEGFPASLSASTTAFVSTWKVLWGDEPAGAAPATIYGSSNTASAPHTWADDGQYTVQVTGYNATGALVASGTRTVTVANVAPTLQNVTASVNPTSTIAQLHATLADPGTIDTWTYTITWGDTGPTSTSTGAVQPGQLFFEHTYAGPGNYTITLTVTDDDGGTATETRQVTVDGLEITAITTEWQDIDGTWNVIADGDPAWFDDTLRWTPTIGGVIGNPAISRIDWQARPWDSPEAGWYTFATAPGSSSLSTPTPALGNPGVGVWAIRAVATLTNGLLFQTQATQKMVAKIESIEWFSPGGADYGRLVEVTANPRPGEQAGDFRLFPDATESGGNLKRSIEVKITVSPGAKAVPVNLKILDVDDPTDNTGPIDDDQVDDPTKPDTNTPDNFGSVPTILAQVSVVGTKTVTVEWPADGRMQPGDNFRILATRGLLPFGADRVKAVKDRPAGELYNDLNADDRVSQGEAFTRQAPGLGAFVATSKLTIWRTLHVYYGSMAEVKNNGRKTVATDVVPDPNNAGRSVITIDASIGAAIGLYEGGKITDKDGNTFSIVAYHLTNHTLTVTNLAGDVTPVSGDVYIIDDDFLQNGDDVPMPDLSRLQRSLQDAFLEVSLTEYSDVIPFAKNIDTQAERNAVTRYWPDELPRPVNSNAFWVAYVIGAFQGPTAEDNDMNHLEHGRLGDGGDGAAMIYLEVIRDESRERGWNASAKEMDTVVHEIAHVVSGLNHLTLNDPVTNWYTTDTIAAGAAIPTGWYPRLVKRYLKGIRTADRPRDL